MSLTDCEKELRGIYLEVKKLKGNQKPHQTYMVQKAKGFIEGYESRNAEVDKLKKGIKSFLACFKINRKTCGCENGETNSYGARETPDFICPWHSLKELVEEK
jgi:hypothetical protein